MKIGKYSYSLNVGIRTPGWNAPGNRIVARRIFNDRIVAVGPFFVWLQVYQSVKGA